MSYMEQLMHENIIITQQKSYPNNKIKQNNTQSKVPQSFTNPRFRKPTIGDICYDYLILAWLGTLIEQNPSRKSNIISKFNVYEIFETLNLEIKIPQDLAVGFTIKRKPCF